MLHVSELLRLLAPHLPPGATDGMRFTCGLVAAVRKNSAKAAMRVISAHFPNHVDAVRQQVDGFFAQCRPAENDLAARVADLNFKARKE